MKNFACLNLSPENIQFLKVNCPIKLFVNNEWIEKLCSSKFQLTFSDCCSSFLTFCVLIQHMEGIATPAFVFHIKVSI